MSPQCLTRSISRVLTALFFAALLALALIVALTAPGARAATFTIPCGDVNALIAAIHTANGNGEADTIELAPNCTYTLLSVDNSSGGDANGLPVITSTLTINAHNSTIQRSVAATETFRILQVDISGTLRLNDATIRNGIAPQGGGLYSSGAVSITHSTIYSNTAHASQSEGGGICNDGGTLYITDSTLLNNQATSIWTYGGGLYSENGLVTIVNSVFAGNSVTSTTESSGGGLYNRGSALTIVNSAFYTNTANTAGGGLYIGSGALTLTNLTVMSNTAGGNGGGALIGPDVTLNGGRFANNQCLGGYCSGGGLYTYGSLTMSGTQFISNTATGDGGGAYAGGDAVLTNGRFENNSGDYGGGLYANNNLALTGTEFIGNTGSKGGGARVAGDAVLMNGRFENNQSIGYGGGLLVWNNLTLTGTQFIHNTAQGDGGGVYLSGLVASRGRVVNALFARNAAGGSGAALYLSNPSAVILHTTIASPTLGAGAAIYVATGTVGITNTIIANYAAGISATAGVTLTLDYNLFFNAPTSIITGSHSLNGDPAFLPDGYHIGPTSAAVDKGIDAGITTDIDHQSRPNPKTSIPDIGADESWWDYRIYLPRVMRNAP